MTGINIGGNAVLADSPTVYVKTFSFESYAQIWKAGVLGVSPPTAVTTNTDDYAVMPQLSPDASQIVFLYDNFSSGNRELRVIDIGGANETVLDDGTAGDCQCCGWHPNGSVILYRIGGSFFTIEPDGSNKTTLYTKANAQRPTYNRDGSLIAFQLSTVGNEEVWVVDGDGTNDMQVAVLAGSVSLVPLGLSWANGGDVLAYGDLSGTVGTVNTVNGDGSDNTVRTSDAVLDRPIIMRLAWAPDDSLLYVNRGGAAPWELWSVDPLGSPGTSETDLGVATDDDDGQAPFIFGGRIIVVGSSGALLSLDIAAGDSRTLDTPGADETIEMWFDSGL